MSWRGDWRKQEISCRTTRTMLALVRSRGKSVEAFLEGLPVDEAYLNDERNWISDELGIELYRRLVKLFDDPWITYSLGFEAAQQRTTGFVDRLVRYLGSPQLVLRAVPALNRAFNHTIDMEVSEITSEGARVRVQALPGFAINYYGCLYTQGTLSAIPTVFRMEPAEVDHPECAVPVDQWPAIDGYAYRIDEEGKVWRRLAEDRTGDWEPAGELSADGTFEVNGRRYGAPACVYHVRWQPTPFLFSLLRERFRRRPSVDERLLQELTQTNLELEARLKELEQLKARLEERVEERTRELSRANEKLEFALRETQNALQAQRQFLVVVSHELRTPLHAILGFTELILEGHTGEISSEARQALIKVLENARRLSRLIQQLLEFARAYRDQTEPLSLTPTDLEALVEEVVDRYRIFAERKGLALSTVVEEEVGAHPWWVDRERVQRILEHLVENAVRFTEEGWVRVEVRREGPGVLLAVADSGPGIPHEAQSRIFDPFRQVTEGFNRTHSGLGLGLAIVRRLTQELGGEVWVESEPGKGSTFYVSLPLQPLPTRETAS